MKEWLKKNHFLIFAIFVGIAMFTISVIRAATTGITYDEAYTYIYYGNKEVWYAFHTLINTTGILANNHILNTLFISIINTITQINYVEFLIRMPNIIFYAVYLIFAYKLSNKYKAKYLCFVLLVFNYGVHEFFGLARGYGMAASLVLVGLYYLKLWLNDKTRHSFLNLSYLFMMFATYANTSVLIVFASVVVYTLIVLIKEKMLVFYIKKYWYFILLMLTLGILIVRYHFNIAIGTGAALYGGGTGFFQDVLVSMFKTYGFAQISVVCAVIYIILYIVGIIYLKKDALKLHAFYIPIICFVILIIMTLVTHQLWLTGRCLIPFMPLIVFGFIELLETTRIDNNIIIAIIAIIMAIPFFYNLNIEQTRDWSESYIIKQEAYKAYEENNNSIMEQYLNDETVNFYRDKILERYNYDILEGVYGGPK